MRGIREANSIRGAVEWQARRRFKSARRRAVLAPIFHSAKAKGRDIIAKIDCEGSEFEIFEVLAKRRGSGATSTAVMVEWHRVVDGKTQRDLIDILVDEGFLGHRSQRAAGQRLLLRDEDAWEDLRPAGTIVERRPRLQSP